MPEKKRRGFTLIEVLIAWALVSALIIGGIEILIIAARIKLKADANLELTDLTTARIEERRSALQTEGAAENFGDAVPFTIIGRRLSTFRGTWESAGIIESPARLGFEIYPELEPEAVVALTILISRELGF